MRRFWLTWCLILFCVQLGSAQQGPVPTEVAGIAKALVSRCENGQVLVKDTTASSGVKCAAVPISSGSSASAPSAWDSGTAYVAGNVVTYSGSVWRATGSSTNSAPSSSNANWSLVTGGIQWIGPYKINTFAGQYIATPGAEGGTFTLTLSGQTTGAIAFNATAATIQAALEALSNVGAGNVTVTLTGEDFSGSDATVIFKANTAAAILTANATSLTGAGAPYSIDPVGAGSYAVPVVVLAAGDVLIDLFLSPETPFDPTGEMSFADNVDGSASGSHWASRSMAKFDLTTSPAFVTMFGSGGGGDTEAMSFQAQGMYVAAANAGSAAQKVPIIARSSQTIYAYFESINTTPVAGEVWIWAQIATPRTP